MNRKHVIIGTAAAGIACATTLRRLNAHDDIICISDEAETPYNKCLLADFAQGEKAEDEVLIMTRELAREKNIELMLGVRIIELNPGEKIIVSDDGRKIAYDNLFLGMGTTPHIPPIEHINGLGTFTFHRLSDVQKILTYCHERGVRKALVVGAGLSGLECADALRVLGIEVTVVDRASRVLASCIDEHGSMHIQEKMAGAGVQLVLNLTVKSIIRDVDGYPIEIELSDGNFIDAHIVICASGLKQNLSLAKNADIKVSECGIMVDEYMRTSIANIYAGGDAVAVTNLLTGKKVASCTWPDAMQQGMVAAHAMVAGEKKYLGTAAVTSSSFFGVKFAVCGDLGALEHGAQMVVHHDHDHYEKIIVCQDKIRSFLLVGDTKKLGILRRALLTNQPFSSIVW